MSSANCLKSPTCAPLSPPSDGDTAPENACQQKQRGVDGERHTGTLFSLLVPFSMCTKLIEKLN